MRVDSDTYVWGVETIVIERKTDKDNPSIDIRLRGPEGDDAAAALYVWGVGKHGARALPQIVLVETEGEQKTEHVLVEGRLAPK